MIIGENIFVMLLVENFSRTLSPPRKFAMLKEYRSAGGIICWKSKGSGWNDGKGHRSRRIRIQKAEDHGWMYGRSLKMLMGTSGRFFTWMKAKCQKKWKGGNKIMKMDPVVHFEMPAEDRNACQDSTWSIWLANEPAGTGNGEYVLVTTTEVDETWWSKNLERSTVDSSRNRWCSITIPSVVIQVDDLKESMKKVEKAAEKFMESLWRYPVLAWLCRFWYGRQQGEHAATIFSLRKERNMTFKSVHISVAIDRPADTVYEFTSNPEICQMGSRTWDSIRTSMVTGSLNPRWAGSKLNSQINKFGVLDHDVTLPSGAKFYNPMRVFPTMMAVN